MRLMGNPANGRRRGRCNALIGCWRCNCADAQLALSCCVTSNGTWSLWDIAGLDWLVQKRRKRRNLQVLGRFLFCRDEEIATSRE